MSSFETAPPAKKPRSLVLGCFGLAWAAAFGLFVLLALVDIATGTENMTGAIGGGFCMGMIALIGVVLAGLGFQPVKKPAKPDFADAKEARAAFMQMVDTSDPESQAINQAAGLMLDHKFVEARQAYEAIAERFPGQRSTAYSQIGAACYFLGDYPQAIHWYEQALAHGADVHMMRDNIEEARAAMG